MHAASLDRIARTVAKGLGQGKLSTSARKALDSLDGEPDLAEQLIGIILDAEPEARAGEDLLGAYLVMLSHALAELGVRLRSGQRAAVAQAGRIRAMLEDRLARGAADPAVSFLVLTRLSEAKIEIGEQLQQRVLAMIAAATSDEQAGSDAPHPTDLAEIARELDDDPFEIHAMLSDIAGALPGEAQVALASGLLYEDSAGLSSAAVGFLLSPSAQIRGGTAAALVRSINEVPPSGATLRRLLAICDWLPPAERPVIEQAIGLSRGRGVSCAEWPAAPGPFKAYAAGPDGAGAICYFVVSGSGRKQAVAGLIGRLATGVIDGWSRQQMPAREAKALLVEAGAELDLRPVAVDVVRDGIAHLLGVNVATGTMPPFGLVAAAELIGGSGIRPRIIPVEDILSALIGEIAPERLTPAAVERTLATSAELAYFNSEIESWYEEGEEIDRLLADASRPDGELVAALLAGPLEASRRKWAERLAWAASLAHRSGGGGDWRAMAIVARALLAGCPLARIGLMQSIAETTLDAAMSLPSEHGGAVRIHA